MINTLLDKKITFKVHLYEIKNYNHDILSRPTYLVRVTKQHLCLARLSWCNQPNIARCMCSTCPK
jgi:hypothetical protein